jgi:probable poly-beta-1,6-N-acetyl-D-glucosamine export protein
MGGSAVHTFGCREWSFVNKRVLDEVFLLRSLACLSIVVLHSMTRIYENEEGIISLLKLFLSFGTPAFILISALVLAHAYPLQSPQGFLAKRVKYILVPFACFAGIYALQATFTDGGSGTLAELGTNVLSNLFLGTFPGYFVLIIFQFYLLHLFFQRQVFPRFRPAAVLAVTGVVQLAYLGVFNFVPVPEAAWGTLVWDRYIMLFPGWLFYFAFAYYCGRNYELFIARLRRHQALVFSGTAASILLLFVSHEAGWIAEVSSKRVDMIPFTICLTLTIVLMASYLKRIPAFFITISRYSFGIYLVHTLVYAVLMIGISRADMLMNSPLGTGLLLVTGLALSLLVVRIGIMVPYGEYIFGRVGMGPKQVTERKSAEPSGVRDGNAPLPPRSTPKTVR